jgi:hypothetical protein
MTFFLSSGVLDITKMENCVYLFFFFLALSVSAQRKLHNSTSLLTAQAGFEGGRDHRYAAQFQSTISFASLFERQQCEIPTDHLCGSAFCCPDTDSCVRRACPILTNIKHKLMSGS